MIKQGDVIDLGDIKIEVTKAVHGFFLTPMKYKGGEIFENVGYIIDDGKKRLYTTSDTINFNNDYKCDILCMPFNGNGITLGIIDGIMFAKDINPELLIPVHLEMELSYMNPNIEILKESLENDSRVLRLNELDKQINENEEIMKLAYKKDMALLSYEDSLKHFKEDSKEVKDAQKALYEAKLSLDKHPLVIEYNNAYKLVRELYNKINEVLFKKFGETHNCKL